LEQQAIHGRFDVVGEVGFAFLCEFERGQSISNSLAKFVYALELLDEAILEWFAFFTVYADFREFKLTAGEVWGLVGRNAFANELNHFVDDLSGSATSCISCLFFFIRARIEGQDVEQEAEHFVGRDDPRCSFGIRVHTNRNRRLFFDTFFDVLFLGLLCDQLRHFERELFAVGLWREFKLVANLVFHELVEVSLAHHAVLVVDDVSALHDLSKELLEIFPRDCGPSQVFEVFVENRSTREQISDVEWLVHVVADASIALALKHHRVEIAESLEYIFLAAVFVLELFGVEILPCLLHVRLDACWCLHDDQDRALHDADGHDIGRVRGEEEAELVIDEASARARRNVFQDLGEFRQPIDHQLDVFEHDPGAARFTFFNALYSDFLHELPHRYDFQLAFVVFVLDVFDHAHCVDTGRVNEHHWFLLVAIGERVVDDVLRLQYCVTICESISQLVVNPVRHDGADAVLTQGADN